MKDKEKFCEMVFRDKPWKEIVKELGKEKTCEILKELVEKDEIFVIPGNNIEDIQVDFVDKDLKVEEPYPYKEEGLKKVLKTTKEAKL